MITPDQYVNAAELIQHMKSEGLVLVNASELAELKVLQLQEMRRRLLRMPALTYKQILDAQLLPVTTKKGIESWIATGKIKEGEVLRPNKGTRKIVTSALKRLGATE